MQSHLMSGKPLGDYQKLSVWTVRLQESKGPDLTVSVNGLLMFLGGERPSAVRRHAAIHDIKSELAQGLPISAYQEIPYVPIYAAAGDEIQFGLVLRHQDGQLINDKVGAAFPQVSRKPLLFCCEEATC